MYRELGTSGPVGSVCARVKGVCLVNVRGATRDEYIVQVLRVGILPSMVHSESQK